MSARVFFTGNLTRDPEAAQAAGQNVVRFSVAVRTTAKDPEGNYITNFYDCTLWGRRGEYLLQRAQKGTVVSVVGELVCATYQGKDGTTRLALRVNADSADPVARMKGEQQAAAQPQPYQPKQTATAAMNDNDFLPF